MKKKLFISLGLLLFILVTGGIWAYNYYIIPDPEVNTQLEEQFGADFFDFNNFKMDDFDLDDNPSGNPSSDVAEEKSSSDSDQKASEQNDSKQTTTTPSNNNEDEATQVKPAEAAEPAKPTQPQKAPPTEESIINRYIPKLKQLEALALDRLDTLFISGLQEYKQNKKEGTLNKSTLSKKYLQASKKLESGVDEAFNQILSEMKEKLTNNNYSTKIIKEIQNEYRDAKSEKMAEFLREVRSQ